MSFNFNVFVMRVLLSVIFTCILGFEGLAFHFIGGDMTYTCLGNGQYLFSVTVYRDCAGTGPQLDDDYDIDVYDLVTGQNVAMNVVVSHDGIIQIDGEDNTDPCIEIPSTLCLEKAVYTGVVQLPLSLNGYYVNFNTCCFALSVANIVAPTDAALSVSTIIPPVGSLSSTCVSSPTFNSEPPLGICLFDDLSLDLGVTWPEYPAATLVYDFYTPENNNGNGPPEYEQIEWLPGFQADSAITSNDDLAINPFTGEVTGTPMQLGNFLMGVEVFAVENGDTLAELNRVFRYTVVDCNINRSISGLEVEPECGDLEVIFSNESFGADTYEWNFDDEDSPNNVVDTESPTHIFSDYGVYNVRLVTTAGGNSACSDTSYVEVILEAGAESIITVNDDYQCLSANDFDFLATSTEDGVTYEWNFGPNANIQTSTSQNPSGVVFNQTGVYPVTLTTYYLECETSTSINVEVFDGLLSDFEGPTEGCLPFEATFNATVFDPSFTYTWTIDGKTFTGNQINHTFYNEGDYSVTLHVIDEDGCESTITEEDYLRVDYVPEVGFNISEEYISAGDYVIFENTANHANYEVTFSIPEYDAIINSKTNFVYTFEEEGHFEIIQTVVNGTCTDQITKMVHVGPSRIVPPNVFTPNSDQVNDFFYINPHYHKDMELHIYDRWGVEVFTSTNYELCDAVSGDFCWDGTDKNGKLCVEGAYAYLIVLPNGYRKTGFVQLFH